MEPHPDRLLRLADNHHVEQLKLAMKANPFTDAAPIVGLVVLKEGKILKPNDRIATLSDCNPMLTLVLLECS